MKINYKADQMVFTFINSDKCDSFQSLINFLRQNTLPVLDRWAYYYLGTNKAIDETIIKSMASVSPFDYNRHVYAHIYYWNYYLKNNSNIHEEQFVKDGWNFVDNNVSEDYESKLKEDVDSIKSLGVDEGQFVSSKDNKLKRGKKGKYKKLAGNGDENSNGCELRGSSGYIGVRYNEDDLDSVEYWNTD